MSMNPSVQCLITGLHRRATQAPDRLAAPTSRDFDPVAWLRACEASVEASAEGAERDDDLLGAAVWFGREAALLRAFYPDRGLANLSAGQAALLAVAMLNREAALILRRSDRETRAAFRNEAVALDHIAQMPFTARGSGQNLNADGYLEAGVDAVNSWLFDAEGLPAEASQAPPSLRVAAREAIQVYSVQAGLNRFWQEALWSGWRLRDTPESLRFEPGRGEIDALFHVWHTRENTHFVARVHETSQAWFSGDTEFRRSLALPRTVVGLDRKPQRKRRFLIGRPSADPRDTSAYAAELAGLRDSYLAAFLERPLPGFGFNCIDLHRVWHVVRDLAALLWAQTGAPEVDDWNSATRWSLVVTRTELVGACIQALGADTPVGAMLDFLTWGREPDKKGLWSAPLVRLAGGREERWGIAYSVLLTGSTVRRTEIWLERGGLNDKLSEAPRGMSFERGLRSELREAIADNPILAGARCAEQAVKRKAEEDIDLVLKLGSTVLIGEIKCFLSPTDPSERFNYLRKLEGAVGQAVKKADFIRDNRAIAARALCLEVEALADCRVLPLVVTNQSFGSGLRFGPCLVVDADFLKIYLSGPAMTYRGVYVTNFAKGREDHVFLYRNAKEAETRFEEAISAPLLIRRLLDRVVWTETAFPTAEGEPFVRAAVVMGEAPDAERDRALALLKAWKAEGAVR